ncbi:hypothetical protein EWM62_18330 [Mucilaginibacter terrigena]|uniref:DUF748 domain-containing protein n=1 Tax=Mucilaginibacter terrigena TaxID=2492395 RepID=A0A4Q5LKV4_9SPHI|nr:hypothetical protein [Mucilaginibacter terrigena]RYU86165.1 hypothetical protein EWM62_18330 [Mucilaginibacter terrigena]
MAVKFLKHKWQKVLLIVVGVLVILVLIPVLFLNSFLAPKLSGKLKEAVLKGTDSLYTIDYTDLDLNILQGKAVLYGITFKPDTAVYNRMEKSGTAPGSLYELHVNRLIISNAHPFELYFKKKLNIGRIALNEPEIRINKYAEKKADTAKKDDRTLYQKISKSLKLIHVGEILFTNINYKQFNYTGPKVAKSELKEMDVKVTDLLIDSATQTDTSRFLYSRDITTELKNYNSKSADGLYNFKVKSVKLSTQTKKLTIAGLDLKPIDHTLFFQKSKKDRFTLRMQDITLYNFDYITYQKSQTIDVKKMVINKGKFEVFSNYNGPLQTTDRLVTFPHWAIRHAIKATLNIDTLDLKHMSVMYSQLNKASKKFGHLKFDNINGRFLNLTNRKEDLAKNNITTANLTSYFMGKAKLDLHFVFNLNDATYNYAYKGHLAPMNMADVNPVLMPLSMVKITSGRVTSFDFNVHSTQKVSKGTVSFLYHDLKVDVLRPDYTKKTLISALANAVIIKHDNPDDGDKTPRLANVVYIRPANFPFFKTVWHVLLNGIKNCAGVGPAQEKKLNGQADTGDKKEQEKIIKKAVKEKEKEDKKFKEAVEDKKKGKKD